MKLSEKIKKQLVEFDDEFEAPMEDSESGPKIIDRVMAKIESKPIQTKLALMSKLVDALRSELLGCPQGELKSKKLFMQFYKDFKANAAKE